MRRTRIISCRRALRAYPTCRVIAQSFPSDAGKTSSARQFIQASTTFHELGHNLGLWHGGAPPTYVKSGAAVVKTVEPNCKPNYLSSMSYLFQLSGMLDDLGHLNLNYSDQQQADLP